MVYIPIKFDDKGDLYIIMTHNRFAKRGKGKITKYRDIEIEIRDVNYNEKLVKLIDAHVSKYMWILGYLNDNNNIKYNYVEETNMPITKVEVKMLPIIRGEWNIVEIPAGTVLYKTMPKTTLRINNKDNPFSDKTGWFSLELESVERYFRRNIDKIYEYVVRDGGLKLIVLDFHNIKKIVEQIRQRINSGISEGKDIYNEIKKIEAIRACTGYMMTFKQQLEYFMRIRSSSVRLMKRKIFNSFNGKRLQIGDDIYSGLHQDLNRFSIVTYVDRILLDAVCHESGYDGYINWNVPSLIEMDKKWGLDGVMHEEIGLCVQRGKIVEK